MKREIFTNMDIQDLEILIRDCIREELSEFKNNKDDEELLKANQVCEYLRISKVTLYKWLKQGKITGYYLGTRLFFKKSEIEKALIKKETLE